nr:MAG TPA: hypothetical protein [Microviridae sp.]DAQ17811.1 MAG TPA: hypothetical protein [Microviridae sp.]
MTQNLVSVDIERFSIKFIKSRFLVNSHASAAVYPFIYF